jgi:mRNA interferase MazF
MAIKIGGIVLCRFYFSDSRQYKNRPVLTFKIGLPFNDFVGVPISSKTNKIDNDNFVSGSIPIKSKLMIRKTFVVSDDLIVKKYGSIDKKSFEFYKLGFCKYFNCTS